MFLIIFTHVEMMIVLQTKLQFWGDFFIALFDMSIY